jgi:hypothetical protein
MESDQRKYHMDRQKVMAYFEEEGSVILASNYLQEVIADLGGARNAGGHAGK